jgi:hypothetical protein
MSRSSPTLSFEPALRSMLPAISGLLATLTAFAPKVMNDGDTWWHVAAGRMMIARRAVLSTDPFSYTFRGAPWFTHEWLSEVLFGGAFNLSGWSGVMLLTGAAAGLTAWLLARDLGRWLSGLPWITVLAFGLVLGAGSMLARPHILTLPLLEIWTAELLRARGEDRGPRWRMLPLMALWANLHGSFIFGLAMISPFALEALLAAKAQDRRAVILRWGGFGLAATAMTAMTPHGVNTLIFPLMMVRLRSLANIGEWRPEDFSAMRPLEFTILVCAFVALTRPMRGPPIRMMLLLILLHESLRHVRYEQMLGIVGALILAQPLAGAYGQTPPFEHGRKPATPWPVAAIAVGLALALATTRLVWPMIPQDGPTAPISSVAAVPPAIARTPVLNDYIFGGYLIDRGIAPFIDSRADMYGDDFLQSYLGLQAPDRAALDQTLTRRRIGWTILVPGSPLAHAMDETPGWRRLRADRWSVIHVRVTPAS